MNDMKTVAEQVENIREELAAAPSERLLRYLAADAAWRAHSATTIAKWDEVELWAKLAADCAARLKEETVGK